VKIKKKCIKQNIKTSFLFKKIRLVLKKIIDKRSRKFRDSSPDINGKPGTLESYYFLGEKSDQRKLFF
jgi:hypothetical protein